MKQTLNNYRARIVIGVACIAIGAICWNGGNACQAQTPANLSPTLQEVVKLTKAQMVDDVIVAYINNSGNGVQSNCGRHALSQRPGRLPTGNFRLAPGQGSRPGSHNPASGARFRLPQPAPAIVVHATCPSGRSSPRPRATGPGSQLYLFSRSTRALRHLGRVGGVHVLASRFRRRKPIQIGVPITIWDSGFKQTMVCFGSRIIRGETSRFTMAVG